jgi:hypothetical protein
MNSKTIDAPARAEKDTVSYSVVDHIAWVQFNRPEKRNCMSPKLNRQMGRVLEELEYRVVPTLLGQQLFPADNPWNQNISNAPVAYRARC